MHSVEEIDYTRGYESQELVKIVQTRLSSIEKNLDLFEEYFMNEWVPAKVSGDMVKILKGIQEQVPENLVRYAYDEMYDLCIEKLKAAAVNDYVRERGESYYRLMEMLGGINGSIDETGITKTLKHKSDFYNTFAVRTLLTIKNNKQAVKIKLEALRKASEDPAGIIDYSSSKISDFLPHRTLVNNGSGPYCTKIKPVTELCSNLLNDSITATNDQTQFEKFCMQELSWIVLCNWEVQDAVYKSIECYSNLEGEKTPEGVWTHIQNDISGKNCKMLEPMIKKGVAQIDNWPKEFLAFFHTELTKPDNNNDEMEMALIDQGGTINQIVGTIKTKLHNGNLINPSVLTGELSKAIDLLNKKKHELINKHTTIKRMNLLDPEIEQQYGKAISKIDHYAKRGNTILKSVNEEIALANSNIESQDNATENTLSSKTIRETENWLSGIKDANQNADKFLDAWAYL